MTGTRFCVFCGKQPESKNKEHVLPQWLLSLTGDPTRTVTLGYNYTTNKKIRFAWQSLVAPACTKCNEAFGELEGRVRPILESLLRRDPIAASDYDTLLDWLDKVRVGLWLTYHLIQKNPTNIDPSFHIESRVRTKDRMVAVYPLGSSDQGLNALGVETLSFHRAPSAFGLRVNNLLLINCSSDYIISGRCGFPFPRKMDLHVDGDNEGMMSLSDFRITRKTKYPLLGFKLHKPSVHMMQPFMQRVGTPMADFPNGFVGDYCPYDSYLEESTLPPYPSGIGKLYRQYKGKVERIDSMDELVYFDSITGEECKPTGRLIAQVYELQNYLQDLCHPVAEERDALLAWNKLQKKLREDNKSYARHYKKEASISS